MGGGAGERMAKDAQRNPLVLPFTMWKAGRGALSCRRALPERGTGFMAVCKAKNGAGAQRVGDRRVECEAIKLDDVNVCADVTRSWVLCMIPLSKGCQRWKGSCPLASPRQNMPDPPTVQIQAGHGAPAS